MSEIVHAFMPLLIIFPSFQPAGSCHAVYTPEASFTRGSSFWSFDTMHQTEVSRCYDAKNGNWSTNLDHDSERVYEGLVRMMLHLPTNPEKRELSILLPSF